MVLMNSSNFMAILNTKNFAARKNLSAPKMS